MKKKYVSPKTDIVETELQQFLLSGSSGFEEGETGGIGTGGGTGDPEDAL